MIAINCPRSKDDATESRDIRNRARQKVIFKDEYFMQAYRLTLRIPKQNSSKDRKIRDFHGMGKKNWPGA
jgi:hypothetical protein